MPKLKKKNKQIRILGGFLCSPLWLMFVLYERDSKTSWFSDIFTYKQMVHLQQFAKDAGVPFINWKEYLFSQK